jgi:integrase
MPRPKAQNTDTVFMTKLSEKLITKGLSAGSSTLYITKLKKLNDDKPYTSLAFLKDTKAVKAKLDDIENINTRKSYTTAIVSILNNTESKQYGAVNIFYKALLNSEKMMYDKMNHNEKSETQKENWIEWEEVLKIYNELQERVDKIKKEDMPYRDAKQDLTDHLILSLYVLSPPRRNQDYYFMKLDTGKKDDEDFNYYRPAENKFIFNKYKTKKNYGVETITVNTQLRKVLDNYIDLFELKDGDFLLYNDRNRGGGNAITKSLNRVFKRKVGASMLRHIYLTSKYGAVKEEMAKDAKEMGHSVAQQKEYILTEG